MDLIHVIGDSHVLRFKDKLFKSHEILYATAHNLIEKNSSSNSRNKIFKVLESINKADCVMLAFGEIDCRAHIVKNAKINKVDLKKEVLFTVERYFCFIKEIYEMGWTNLLVFAPVASTPFYIEDSSFPTFGTVEERNMVTLYFKECLEDFCSIFDIPVISIYDDLLESEFHPAEKYYQNDKIYIKPEYQVEFFKNRLRDLKIPFKYGGRNRKISFNKVLNYLDNIKNPIMVEIGQTRNLYNWEGDGYSTPLFSWYTLQRQDCFFYSIDINNNLELLSKIFDKWGMDDNTDKINFVVGDGIKFLEDFTSKIDFIYLDAWDYHRSNVDIQNISEIKHLEAFKIVEPKLNKGAMILIDDILDSITYVGKGKLLIPYLITNGYSLVHGDYQFLFQKVK